MDPFHCENTIGSFECACPYGYEKGGGGCNNIDECAEEIDECTQGCKDEPGSYYCQCYVPKSSDSKTCSDINECQTDAHTCSELFECNNTIGGVDCLCKDGYTLKEEKCIYINECEQSNSTCEHTCGNTDGSFICSCRKGFALQPDARTCDPQFSEFNSIVYISFTPFTAADVRSLMSAALYVISGGIWAIIKV